MKEADNADKKQKLGNFQYVFKNIILPRKWILLGGLGIIIVNRLAGLVIPGASKFLIDNIIFVELFFIQNPLM